MFGNLLEGNFQLVQAILTAFIHPWSLARRTYKQSGKQIGQGRMVEPVSQETSQDIRTTENRAICRRPTDDDMIASPGASMLAIQHEFFRAKSGSGHPRTTTIATNSSHVWAGWMLTSMDDRIWRHFHLGATEESLRARSATGAPRLFFQRSDEVDIVLEPRTAAKTYNRPCRGSIHNAVRMSSARTQQAPGADTAPVHGAGRQWCSTRDFAVTVAASGNAGSLHTSLTWLATPRDIGRVEI